VDRAAFNEEKILPLQNQDRSLVGCITVFPTAKYGVCQKEKTGNKTTDEIEAFGGSQEAWGNPFLLI